MRCRRTSKLVQFQGDEIESVSFNWFDVWPLSAVSSSQMTHEWIEHTE